MKRLFLMVLFLPWVVLGVNPSLQESTNIASVVSGAGTVLLNPTHVGPGKTLGGYSAIQTSDRVLMAAPNTSGIVRDFYIQADLGTFGILNSNCPNVNLQIYADCGSDTNSPAISNFQFNVPLSSLMMNRYHTNNFGTNASYSIQINSALVDVIDITANQFQGTYVKTVHLKTPAPFTNGCLVRLFNTASNAAYALGYIGGTVEKGPINSMGVYSNYRLRSGSSLKSTTLIVSNFLFNVRGPGVLVGAINGVADSSGSFAAIGYLDSHAIRITDGLNVWEATGGDDLFLSTFMFTAQTFSGYDYGLTHIWRGASGDSSSMNWDVYRWFTRDGPSWTNSTAVVSIAPNGSVQVASDVFIYYSP